MEAAVRTTRFGALDNRIIDNLFIIPEEESAVTFPLLHPRICSYVALP